MVRQLAARMADHHHRDIRAAQDFIDRTAEQHMSQRAATVRAHHDRAGVLLLGHLENFQRRLSRLGRQLEVGEA